MKVDVIAAAVCFFLACLVGILLAEYTAKHIANSFQLIL